MRRRDTSTKPQVVTETRLSRSSWLQWVEKRRGGTGITFEPWLEPKSFAYRDRAKGISRLPRDYYAVIGNTVGKGRLQTNNPRQLPLSTHKNQ